MKTYIFFITQNEISCNMNRNENKFPTYMIKGYVFLYFSVLIRDMNSVLC